jgi:hypothetical protein
MEGRQKKKRKGQDECKQRQGGRERRILVVKGKVKEGTETMDTEKVLRKQATHRKRRA